MQVESSVSDQKRDLISRLTPLMDSIKSSLRQNSDVLDNYPLDSCVEAACLIDRHSFAAMIPIAQESILRKLSLRYKPEQVRDWNRLTLLRMVQLRLSDEQFQILPAGVRDWSFTWFAEMLDQAGKAGEHFDFCNPDGSKHWDLCFDFAVAAGRMLPVGGAWAVERKRMLRDSLFKSRQTVTARLHQTIERFERSMRRTIARRASLRRAQAVYKRPLILWREARSRYGSYLVIHTANHYRRWFSEPYQQIAFTNIAALLEFDPKLEGLYRSSWLLDPQVIEMEPRLGFLIATPTVNGARYGWRADLDVEDHKEILAFSTVRRKNFAAGSYRPQEWAYLWPRDAIARWSESQ